MKLIFTPEHSVTWRTSLGPDSSIDASAEMHHLFTDEDGVEMFIDRFECPYCWDKCLLMGSIQERERLVVVCERTWREFAVLS